MKIEEKIVHSIIATKVNLFHNEEVSRTPFYDKELKNYGNLYLKALMKREKFFDELENLKEDQAIGVHDVFYDYIKAISTVNIQDMECIALIVEAYHKDKKKLEKVINEIL